MEATITWLDLTTSDRDKLRRILDLFKEKGTIDELGLGSLRDMFSESLFPGVNTLQTRLRYAIFIPWIYKAIESRNLDSIENVEVVARQAETRLIKALLEGTDTSGIIGVQAGDTLVRLPSNIYWNALKRWGIFEGRDSQSRYHEKFRSSRINAFELNADLADSRQSNWHVRLPEEASSFPRKANFSLTRAESQFIQGRLEQECHGTLLAWLARNGSSELDHEYLWESSAATIASSEIRETIEVARRFSLHVEGMPLLYNLLIAELRIKTGASLGETEVDIQRAQDFRQGILEWAELEEEEQSYDIHELRNHVSHGMSNRFIFQLQFVERWSNRVKKVGAEAIADDAEARQLISERELKLKKNRARLRNIERLRSWQGGVGIGRMTFRWHTVRRLLSDLFEGLASK